MTSNGSAPDIVFRGIDGNEAEEFIAAIEDLAFTEGWSEDNKRMLLFARSRLRQGAVRWFARLDPSKKKDWDLFVEALLDQYPQVQAPAEAEISTPVWSATTFSPSASTAILPSDQVLEPEVSMRRGEGRDAGSEARHSALPRSRAYDPSILGRHLGVLRILVEDGTPSPQYIWRGRPPMSSIGNGYTSTIYQDPLETTVDRHEALVVCFIPSQKSHTIGCLNTTRISGNLSLYNNSYDLYVANGRVGSSSALMSTAWNVLPDGTLQAWLSEDAKTSEVFVHSSGTCSIQFGKPDPKSNPAVNLYKARIVFEPI